MTEEHRKNVFEDLKLKDNVLLKKAPEIRRKVIDLVQEFADIFSEEGKHKIG